MEWATKKIRSPSNQMPNYDDIVLSYSDEETDFARQLYMKLKSSNYTPMFVDQDSKNTTNNELFKTAILETMEHHCQLAIIVLSKGYLTSKRSMLELSTFWKWKSTNNPSLKVFPLFYKLTSSDLYKREWYKSWNQLVQDGEVQEEETFLWGKTVRSLLGAQNEELKSTKALLKHLIQSTIEVEEFCILFNESVKDSWECNGLFFEHYGNSIVKYLSAIIGILSTNMPPTKENKTNQSFGNQHMLEMQSKLSLQMMKDLLEKEPSLEEYQKYFLFHKAEILQQRYMGWNTFEEMCSDSISQKNEMLKLYGRGRVTAALFPNAFLYYFKALMLFGALYFDHDTDYLPVLIDAANTVAKRWKDLSVHGHQSFYVDVDACIDVGPILSHEGIVALCKNFEDGEGEFGYPQANISKQYGIVQDDLTGVFYCRRVEASALGEPIHTEAIGVIGVKLTSTNIHVEDMSEDGSYYSGIFEDFSYEFGHDQNDGDPIHKQCAAIAFGDLEGMGFLKQKHGIKCSPLLLIALACASQRKGLKLNWNDKYGHMEIDPKLVYSQPSESKGNECQILFTSKIKELGVAVVWGMDPMALDPQSSGASPYFNKAQKIGGSMDNGKKQIAHDSQSGDTSNHSVTVTDCAAVYGAASQDKKKFSVEGKGLGSGGTVSWECQDRKAHELKALNQDKLFEFHWKGKGGYEEQNVPHAKHGDLKTHLIQGALHAAKLNYLVVYDDIVKSHVSIYCVKEGEGEDELEWITDVFLKKGQQQCEDIFKDSLKGKDLTINRVSTTFTSITPANKLTGFFSLFKKKTNIVEGKMIELLDLGPKGSKDEWEHLIGLQENCSGEEKFWWQASFMQAVLCSRTRFSTGKLLTTRTSVEKGIPIGHCQEEPDVVNPAKDYKHGTTKVIARGKFSRAPASQGARILYWGGLKNLQ